MGALLSLLRSDYKQQPSTKKTRSATTIGTRGGVAGAAVSATPASNRRGNADGNDYEGTNESARSSTREVVFPDSFEVLPQPRDLSVVYMGVPHEQQRKFRCRFCGKGYRWKSTMRRHEMVECGGKPPAFQCPECPYKARQRGNLTVHYKRHHQKIGYDEGA